MAAVSIEDIQQDILSYLKRVSNGETLLVLQENMPIAEIKPVAVPIREPRPFGFGPGEFTVPDDFDDRLPEEIIRHFEGR